MSLAHEMQLYDLSSGRELPFSGAAYITAAGAYEKAALYDDDDALITGSNARQFTNGRLKFRTLETVTAVDIYGQTQYGYTFQLKNVKPGAVNAIRIDLNRMLNHLVVPFSVTDAGANTEYDTGIDLVKDVPILPWGSGIYVATADSGITIDVGTDSTSGANDPDGFMDGVLLTTAGQVNHQVGYVIGSNSVYVDLTGGTAEWTTGALFHPASTKAALAEGTDSATTKNGIAFLKSHNPSVGGSTAAYVESLTYTLASSADTGKGLIILPQQVLYVPSF